MQSEKKSKAIPCWLSDQEVKMLDGEIEMALRSCPGARLTRSAYLAQVFRQHVAEKYKVSKEKESR